MAHVSGMFRMLDSVEITEDGCLASGASVRGYIKHSSNKFKQIDCSIQQEPRGVSVTFDLPGNPNACLEIDDSGYIVAYVWPHEDSDAPAQRVVLYAPRRT